MAHLNVAAEHIAVPSVRPVVGTQSVDATRLETLARSIAELDIGSLDASAIMAARMCLVDCLGSGAAGSRHASSGKSQAWVATAFGQGDASVWFTGRRMSMLGAAYLNAHFASVLDMDDGHRAAAGHPGAAVIPAVLAVAEETNASFSDVLGAIICGYEAGVQIARARDRRVAPGVATGRWSAAAVAAAVARLLGLSPEQIAAAIGIAEPLASNLDAADHEGFIGGEVKEGVPWSVVVGLCAAFQARAGGAGYRRALDNHAVYRPGGALGPARIDSPLLQTAYFKPYACCRWLHSAIDAALVLRDEGLVPSDIEAIRVSTFARAASLPNLPDPPDIIVAQFSLPFVLAAALIEGPSALMPMEPHLLSRGDIVALARKVEIAIVDEYDSLFPGQVPARVEVVTSGGSVARTIMIPKGDPGNPMTSGELTAKARHLLSLALSPETAEEICTLAMTSAIGSNLPIRALLSNLNRAGPSND